MEEKELIECIIMVLFHLISEDSVGWVTVFLTLDNRNCRVLKE